MSDNELLKGRLRKEVLAARRALDPDVVAERSARAVRRLLAMDEYRQASTVMVYLSLRDEVQTGELIAKAMGAGKRVAVPAVDVVSRTMTPSLLLDFPGDLQPGAWGILEPSPQALRPLEQAELDLVVVPGVVFDLQGNRLGYGAGFYDRFLPRTGPSAVFAALAFELQVRPEICREQHDVPVHFLLTEDRLIRTMWDVRPSGAD